MVGNAGLIGDERWRRTLGHLLLRGLGWGAAIGFAGGFVLLGLAGVLSRPQPAVLLFVFPVGLVSGAVGSVYGAIAGMAVATFVAPILRWRYARVAGRVIGAVVGTLVVAAMSAAVFDPDWDPGPNETENHVRDDIVVFYVLPCIMAATAGALLTPKLLISTNDPVAHSSGRIPTPDRNQSSRGVAVRRTRRRRRPGSGTARPRPPPPR